MFLHLQLYVDTLVKRAYDNWDQVVEYDGKSLLSFKLNKRSITSRDDLQIDPSSYTNVSDNQLPLPQLPALEQSPVNNTSLPATGNHSFPKKIVTLF